jgi:ArsR family transcriptional regulator
MDVTDVFKALGDASRLKIVCMVAEAGELCVCRIVEAMDMGQPAVSHHLARLRYAGILRARKQGQWVHYSLNVDALEQGALEFLRRLVEEARCAGRQAQAVHKLGTDAQEC